MPPDRAAIEQAIKDQIVAIVDQMGDDARGLARDELIPASGLIDSAGLLQLLAWYEQHYAIPLAPEDLTIDNLGSIALMADYLLRRQAGR